MGLFVQKVVLVYFFPNLNAGYSLLAGADYQKFHLIAVELADKIRDSGWSAWRLQPEGQAVSGIAAVFYALFNPQPWVLLPWNAFLHALSVFFLYKTLLLILKNKNCAFIASLPCAFFPSSFAWTIMMHNENYINLGVMMVLFSWAKFFHDGELMSIAKFFSIYMVNFIGLGLIFMVRFATAQAMSAIILLSLLGYVFLMIFRIWILKKANQTQMPSDSNLKIKSTLAILSRCILLAISLLIFLNLKQAIPEIPNTIETPPQNKVVIEWQRSDWLPRFIDDKLNLLVRNRKTQIIRFPHGATNVDQEVPFNNSMDVVKYLPRAFQLGFFSPFPSQWFESGYKIASKMQRRISGAEMIISYFALFALPIAFWYHRNAFDFWFVTLACIGMVVIYSISMPNIGTLYRFRYQFFTLLVGIGLATWADIWFKLKRITVLRKAHSAIQHLLTII